MQQDVRDVNPLDARSGEASNYASRSLEDTMGIATELLGLLVAGGVLAGFVYWVALASERARQRQLQALNLARSHHQPWDADIGARRRER